MVCWWTVNIQLWARLGAGAVHGEPYFVLFAIFHVVNSPIMADFKLSMWVQWTHIGKSYQNWEELGRVIRISSQVLWACFNTPKREFIIFYAASLFTAETRIWFVSGRGLDIPIWQAPAEVRVYLCLEDRGSLQIWNPKQGSDPACQGAHSKWHLLVCDVPFIPGGPCVWVWVWPQSRLIHCFLWSCGHNAFLRASAPYLFFPLLFTFIFSCARSSLLLLGFCYLRQVGAIL